MFNTILFSTCCIMLVLVHGADIIDQKSDSNPDGSFQWSYETSDGSSQQQEGREGPEGGQAIQGVAQWSDPAGHLHRIQYVADENGFLPNSDDLPIAPEIPAGILRGLEWNSAHPEEDNL
ncbi:larval cuticle protein III/IV-like [Anthonomus grandis grandis]|uniref:larval cuticle protein III/IV-like n=1 Tax=Anthonomus grandis grandis TaxID=2921223 RepID=UPI00216554CB|nr:larval cuticle protein III/IV-like [Anthonomus grandis grandis]